MGASGANHSGNRLRLYRPNLHPKYVLHCSLSLGDLLHVLLISGKAKKLTFENIELWISTLYSHACGLKCCIRLRVVSMKTI